MRGWAVTAAADVARGRPQHQHRPDRLGPGRADTSRGLGRTRRRTGPVRADRPRPGSARSFGFLDVRCTICSARCRTSRSCLCSGHAARPLSRSTTGRSTSTTSIPTTILGCGGLARPVPCRCRAGLSGFKLKIGRGHRWLDRAAATAATSRSPGGTRRLPDREDPGRRQRRLRPRRDPPLSGGRRGRRSLLGGGPFTDDADDLAELRAHLDAVSPATLTRRGRPILTSPPAPDRRSRPPRRAADGRDVVRPSPWRRSCRRWSSWGLRLAPCVGPAAEDHLRAHSRRAGNVAIVEGVPGVTDGVEPRRTCSLTGADAVGAAWFRPPVPRT